MPPLDAIALFLLAVLAGGVAGVAGFGIGSILTPALAVSLGTQLAVAVVAAPHVAATATRLWMLRSDIDRRVLLTFGLASAAGGLIGAIGHALFSSDLLSLALGGLLILAGLLELTGVGRRMRLGGGSAVAAGVLSGVFGGLVGNQGGIRSAALLRFPLSPMALVATATATALLVDAARVPVYLLTSGEELVASRTTVLLLTVGVLVGTFIATPILRRVPERLFRRSLAILIVLLGAVLVASAAA
ncbi:MAG TPA: TSUP family transporter [Candidatus Limnocylindria bacterium]|nr:TSUP family transporter [Candidatus Limnocylindria bacterium]